MSTINQDKGYLVTVARDVASVTTLGIILIYIHEGATPFFRGFHCEDETIRYPFKDSTIPSSMCYFGGSFLNIILILVLEFLKLNKARNTNSQAQTDQFPLRLYVRNVYCRLLIWLFGAISSELLTDISKFSAGRLRPHFISVCKPRISPSGSSLEEYCKTAESKYQYIIDYKCDDSVEPHRERDTRMSFMSGHSSYSAYSAAFAVIYLQSSMDVASLGLMKPALQVLISSTAFYTGLTRVSDYKHHWQDVLAGLLQGTFVAILVSRFVWPSFHKRYQKQSSSRVGEELSRVCDFGDNTIQN